jgi:hypothetical protein
MVFKPINIYSTYNLEVKMGDILGAIKDGITGIIDQDYSVSSGTAAAVVGGSVLGGAVLGTAISSLGNSKTRIKRSTRKKRKKITHTKRGRKQDRARRSKQPWELSYQRKKRRRSRTKSKRKSIRATGKSRTAKGKSQRTRKGKRCVSGKKVFMTKNGQPYIKMASGKCRFIKKR